MTVVGGWYEERCAEPRWEGYYGPGGRAAIALAGRSAKIQLLTYCPLTLRSHLEYDAAAFGFVFEAFGTAPAVTRFHYLHWLRPPRIFLASLNPSELPPIYTQPLENVIRYGLYEGDAVVRAKRAVYDPQNALNKVRPYSENGSTAEELFIVCNFAEGAQLTGEKSPDKILTSLLKTPNAVGVALKNGWEGVFAATQQVREHIKPIPTTYVHKIGSGDVFTAESAFGWMVLGLDPIAAARLASTQVAYYSANASLPIPESATITPAPAPAITARNDPTKKYDVYVASPFFNYAQLSVIEELAEFFLDAGLRVFSPYHDVGLGLPAHVAKQDLDALEQSRLLLAYVEGYDPGTIYEVGYARALGIPVLVYGPNLAEIHSTMFVGTDCQIARDFTTAVYRAIWWANAQ